MNENTMVEFVSIDPNAVIEISDSRETQWRVVGDELVMCEPAGKGEWAMHFHTTRPLPDQNTLVKVVGSMSTLPQWNLTSRGIVTL